jgi:DNA-binding SARP family transcriptional activator
MSECATTHKCGTVSARAKDRPQPQQGRSPVEAATLRAGLVDDLLDRLSMGVVVLDATGDVIRANTCARGIFGEVLMGPGVRCCDLVGCGRGDVSRPLAYHCICAAVLERGRRVSGLEFTVGGRRMQAAGVPLTSGVGVLLELTPTGEQSPVEVPGSPLHVTALGPLSLRRDGVPLGGEWVHHRPGKLLRYLLCSRGHRVPVEELVEAIWPDSGRAGLISLRQAVHVLRERLEPDRARQAPSHFLRARSGGYELSLDGIVVDADDFEARAHAALLAVSREESRSAARLLERAAASYVGDFLSDGLYDECASGERDRLRDLVLRVLRQLADLELSAGEPSSAARALQRLVELEPLDLEAQRELISLMLSRGEHAAAVRRYDAMRRKFKGTFASEPGFTLADLVPAAAA